MQQFCLVTAFLAVSIFSYSVSVRAGDQDIRRIVNGTRAENLRWFVTVRTAHFDCGGTLIAYDTVLTAAHCIDPKGLLDTYVWYGAKRFFRRSKVGVHSIVIHRSYRSERFWQENDIAIIFLKESLENENVSLVEWYGRGLLPGAKAWVAGFGDERKRLNNQDEYKQYKFSRDLLKAEVEVLSNNRCVEMIGPKISQGEVCAWSINSDTCRGDSGGPLYFVNQKKYYQIGIVSNGNGCQDPRYPGIYTRVAYFSDWIQDKINNKDKYYPNVWYALT